MKRLNESAMKSVYLSLVDNNLKYCPSEDTPGFTVFLNETPTVGDEIFISHSEPVAYEDQSNDLYNFCRESYPDERGMGYSFKVIKRTFMRCDWDAHASLDVVHIPGILKRNKSVESVEPLKD